MATAFPKTGHIDRLAIGLSGLCAVHCVATAVLLGLLASAGGILGSPLIHEIGLTLAILLAAFALGRGALRHGFLLPLGIGSVGLALMAYGLTLHETWKEPVVTILGVSILAIGHRLNCRAAERADCGSCSTSAAS